MKTQFIDICPHFQKNYVHLYFKTEYYSHNSDRTVVLNDAIAAVFDVRAFSL